MNFLKRVVGWGISIYAVMYLLWSGLVIFGFGSGYGSLIVRVAALALVTTIAARAVQGDTWKDLLPYSVGWAAVALVLDAVYLVPFSGWTLYASWSVWVGYALVAFLPVIVITIRARRAPQAF